MAEERVWYAMRLGMVIDEFTSSATYDELRRDHPGVDFEPQTTTAEELEANWKAMGVPESEWWSGEGPMNRPSR